MEKSLVFLRLYTFFHDSGNFVEAICPGRERAGVLLFLSAAGLNM